MLGIVRVQRMRWPANLATMSNVNRIAKQMLTVGGKTTYNMDRGYSQVLQHKQNTRWN